VLSSLHVLLSRFEARAASAVAARSPRGGGAGGGERRRAGAAAGGEGQWRSEGAGILLLLLRWIG